MADRLYRSTAERMLAGVAGGLAQRFDTDPSIVRVIWAVSVFLTGGVTLLIYIVMAVVVPEAPEGYAWRADGSGGDGPDGGGSTFGSPARSRDRGGNGAGLIFGLVLIGVGVIFLIRELLPAIDLSLSWPILALVLGIALVVLSIRPRRSSG